MKATAATRPVVRRALGREEAAIYLGISPSKFDRYRREGRLPAAIDMAGDLVWDVQALALSPKFTHPVVKERGVYVVGFGCYVKIGFSANIEKRLCEIQCGIPEDLIVHRKMVGAAPAIERNLFSKFRAHRLSGEWFRLEGEIAEWVEAGCP